MTKPLRLRTKRIYEPPSRRDGVRILVDRLWPRGIKKADCELDAWRKELAPSDALRRWFAHDPDRWDEFQRRYFRELDKHRETCQDLLRQARTKTVTFLYAAKDLDHNNAVALKNYLERLR